MATKADSVAAADEKSVWAQPPASTESLLTEVSQPADAVVVGIGRLGLCFALTLEAAAGLRVIGVDLNPTYITLLNERKYRTTEPRVEEFLGKSKNFVATTDLAAAMANPAPLVFILVPTPTSGGRNFYDHAILGNVLQRINEMKVANKHVIINATVMPGYINKTAKTLLRDCTNTTISYNPAFTAQGEIMEGYRTGGMFGMVLVGAENDAIFERLREIYLTIAGEVKVNVCRMSPESAEICKLSSNCFRTTKISFANMVGDIADRTPGADKFDICNALGMDASIGPKCIRPGYGYGGPCYPRDNRALAKYAESIGIEATIPIASDRYNEFHHDVMAAELLERGDEAYTFDDVGYKPRLAVAMIDESPVLAVAARVAKAGKRVVIRDNKAKVMETMKEYGNMFEYEIIEE